MAGRYLYVWLSSRLAVERSCGVAYEADAEYPVEKNRYKNQHSEPQPQSVDLAGALALAVLALSPERVGYHIGIYMFILSDVFFLAVHNLFCFSLTLKHDHDARGSQKTLKKLSHWKQYGFPVMRASPI